MTLVKICGLTTPETVDAAIEAGADYLGFNFFPRSPRVLTLEQAAPLIALTRNRAVSIALLVNPDDATLEAVAALRPDMIQLHGDETPERVADVRERTGLPVIKVFAVSSAADLAASTKHAADHLLYDAKPPTGAAYPGGHGAPFDWSLLSPLLPAKAGIQAVSTGTNQSICSEQKSLGPRVRGEERDGSEGRLWFLAGGLTPDNVAEAVRVTGAPAVDVSSGVESAPGVKDPALIAAFIRAAKAAAPDTP